MFRWKGSYKPALRNLLEYFRLRPRATLDAPYVRVTAHRSLDSRYRFGNPESYVQRAPNRRIGENLFTFKLFVFGRESPSPYCIRYTPALN
jgi:hypothetical protein